MELMLKSQALFLTVLDNKGKRVLGGIMLPNTKHMGRNFNKKEHKEMMLRHLAKHHFSYIDTSCLILDVVESKGYIQPKRDSSKGKRPPLFNFNNAYHRFTKGSVLEDGDLSKAQKEYLESTIITHAWGAIHNGIVVGLVMFPILDNNPTNCPKFLNYLSDSNVLLKKIGYFISGDLVLTKGGELKFFRVLKNKSVGNAVIKNWTQELILTKSLKSLTVLGEE